MCLILFIVCNTPDDSVFYNIVRSAMAVNSFHDQIIIFRDEIHAFPHIIFMATFYIS